MPKLLLALVHLGSLIRKTIAADLSAAQFKRSILVRDFSLSRREVVRRPWSRQRDLHVFELPHCQVVSGLVFLDALGIDQVGDVEEHAGLNLLAGYFLIQRVE